MTNTATELNKLKTEQDAARFGANACGSCRQLHPLAESCKIPNAPLYVCSTDSFMSGWGGAKDTVNVCVVPVADYEEAEKVKRFMLNRTELKYIRITRAKPHPRGRRLSLLLGWRKYALEDDYPKNNLAEIIAEETPKPEAEAKNLAQQMQSISHRLHHYAETMCNRELTDKQGRRVEKLKEQITALAAQAGLAVLHINMDPRGFPVYLKLPSNRSNSMGGEGWGIGL